MSVPFLSCYGVAVGVGVGINPAGAERTPRPPESFALVESTLAASVRSEVLAYVDALLHEPPRKPAPLAVVPGHVLTSASPLESSTPLPW